MLNKIFYWNVWTLIALQSPFWVGLYKINKFHAIHLFRYMYSTYEEEIKARQWWEERIGK